MTPRILAIDPGTTQSGVVRLNNGSVTFSETMCNQDILTILNGEVVSFVAIEMIASYGMAVGRETFETCLWIGRFIEAAGQDTCRLVYRRDIKLHLCGTAKAKDANIRQAILDRFGGSAAIGTKKAPGPLYGIAGHMWAALAVALYAADNWPLKPFDWTGDAKTARA